MSIQTELTRIINAKAAIKTAVEGKGVTVPDGTLLDGMAALIDAIEAGGGDTILGYKFLSGTITLAEQSTDAILLVEGGQFKSTTPGFCALWNSNIKFVGGVEDAYVGVSALTGGTSYGITSKGNNASNYKMFWEDSNGNLSLYSNSTYNLAPGVTYCWIMLYKL